MNQQLLNNKYILAGVNTEVFINSASNSSKFLLKSTLLRVKHLIALVFFKFLKIYWSIV